MHADPWSYDFMNIDQIEKSELIQHAYEECRKEGWEEGIGPCGMLSANPV
jgi:hypothetical protein